MALSSSAATPARPTLTLLNADGSEVLDVDQPQVLSWGLPFADATGAVSPSNGLSYPRHVRDVVAVVSGNSHTVALQRNGRVVAWSWGTLGSWNVPVGLANIVAIDADGDHSMALRRDGTVVMWGEPGTAWTTVPDGLKDVVAIATGGAHALALRRDGTVVAWGRNWNNEATVPEGLTDVVMIAAGTAHSMALKADGTVIAWGLGGGTVAAQLSDVVSIAAGGPFSGAIMRDGKAVTWSTENSSVVTVGTAMKSLSFDFMDGYSFASDGAVSKVWNQSPALPAEVNIPTNPTLAVTSNAYQATALHRDGTLTHWNMPNVVPPKAPQNPVDLTQTLSITANHETLLALRADGSVVGWGNSPLIPRPALKGIATLAMIPSNGQRHTLAFRNDGQVMVLGQPGFSALSQPPNLGDVISVASGWNHSVVVKSDGSVVAWGNNSSGQCEVPSGLSRVSAVAAGRDFTLALKQDGVVVAWGINDGGQCKVPAGLKGVVSLAAGNDFSLALKDDGKVVAWGRNFNNQCEVPKDLKDVVSIFAVEDRSVAVKNDGTIVQWGAQYLLQGNAQKWVPPTGVIAAAPGYGRLSVLVEAPGDFGARPLRSVKHRHDLLLSSCSSAGLTGIRAVIEGPDADQFGIVGSVAGSISGWSQMTLPVVFLPLRLGPARATLTIFSNDPDGPLIVPLTGSGVLKSNAVPKTSTPSVLTRDPLRVDRQTGLVLQKVTFTNITGSALSGLKLTLSRIAPGITVYSSSVGKVPSTMEVLYTRGIAPGEVVSFDLVFFDPQQRTTSTIQPTIVVEQLDQPEPRPGPVAGASVPLRSVRDSVQGPLLEWNAARGQTYVVEYSDNGGTTWFSAVHRLVGGNRILWVDRGQPETAFKPVSKGVRAYRVKRLGA